MNFKTHLAIISGLILIIYLVIQILTSTKPAAPVQNAAVKSPYSITIENASWGLNCYQYKETQNTNSFAVVDEVSNEVKENNVLKQVSSVCNAQSACNIHVDPRVLGADPLPNCGYKKLEIEFRCFSIDRLRKKETADAVLNIDCEKILEKQ